jgi:hypothetical protein
MVMMQTTCAGKKSFHMDFESTASAENLTHGLLHLDGDFYDKNAGVLIPSEHYLDLFEHSG